MSIIIKQDQINMLVYKYLLESGLKHTAFSLFHEASLDKIDLSLQKVPPKMLIGYLEKALIFNQIETHIVKDEPIECKESFELLVPHQCRTAEAKRQEMASKINQFNHNLESFLNEDDTSVGVINKVKVTNEDILKIATSHKLDIIALYGENDDHVSLWKIKVDSETSKTSLTPSGIIDFNSLQCKKEDFVTFQWDASGEYIMLAFRDGGLFFFDSNHELKNLIKIQPGIEAHSISWNPFASELLSVIYEENYLIINPLISKIQANRNEKVKDFIWQNAKNFAILTADDMIYLYEDENDMSIQSFTADEGTEKIKFSNNSLFLGSFSSKANSIKVWIMSSTACLYSFSDNAQIKDFVWNSSEEGGAGFFNFLVIIYNHSVKLFDIEYGEIKCTIDLEERVPIVSSLLYNRDTYVMITQENGTMSVYSLFASNKDSKRLHYIQTNTEMKQLMKWGSTNAIGTSKNDLVILKLKKILP